MSHGDLGIISKKDALIIISNSGNSNELSNLLKFTAKNSVSVIGITANSKSELMKYASITLLIPNANEACSIGLAPTTSTTMALVLGDALCVSLMKLKKFNISSERVRQISEKSFTELKNKAKENSVGIANEVVSLTYALMDVVFFIFIAPVITFYLLMDWDISFPHLSIPTI